MKEVFDVKCPTCGLDRSFLLGCSHDYVLDCPKCRLGSKGINGSKGCKEKRKIQ